jgi:hypothetical protein
MSPVGVASPSFAHGRRSRYLKDLPRDLRNGYRAALADPEHTALVDELGVLETRIGQLLRRLSETTVPPWGPAVESLEELTLATNAGNAGRFRVAFEEHARILRAGAEAAAAQSAVWKELQETIRLKVQTAAAEARRLHELRAYVPVELALGLVAAVAAAARDTVRDADDLRRLQQSLIAILPPVEDGP